MADFRFSVNAAEVAAKLDRSVGDIAGRVRKEVENLSVAAHAFIIKKANDELTGFKRESFLGADNKNVRWTKVANSIWVVEIDEKARWIEEGRPKMFMDWLLDKNPKAKTAKDGSKYASIPFTQERGKGGQFNNPSPVLAAMVNQALKREGINLKKIEFNPDGSAKLGVLHKLSIDAPGTSSQFPTLFSNPRTAEMSALSGLPMHDGIFLLKDAVVTQRMGANKKVIKEVMTFRTISSKHKMEGRWEYPEVQPFNSLQAASDWAKSEWEQIVKRLEEEFRQG